MRSHVASIEIAADPAETFAFVADLARLPSWAIGFAKAIERTTPAGWSPPPALTAFASASRRTAGMASSTT